MNNKILFTVILFISIFNFQVYANDSSLEIEGAWISEAPPVSKVMVAYMTIKNTGAQDIEITLAESDIYSSIEFHETVHRDGMARMIRHGSLTIPANGSIQLKRGGKHLMMFNPVKHLKAGDTVSIIFTTQNNMKKTVVVDVKKH